MPTESEFLDWLYAQRTKSDHVVLGAGDDLAILKTKPDDLLLVGIDQVLDGVHFDSREHDPLAIGRKVMNRNVSDCAAMACLPFAAVVSAALPRSSDLEFAKALYSGLREAADPFACAIAGGDTSVWEGKLAMSVAILGRSAGIEPIRRSDARPGDRIYVTGPLGGSILGRHMTFSPRVALARELARSYKLTAMIDISDGLARDLDRICRASTVSAELDAARIPIHADAVRLASQRNSDPLDHALGDGEDHELLFTSPDRIEHAQCVEIGQVVEATAGAAMQLRRGDSVTPHEPRGWDAH